LLAAFGEAAIGDTTLIAPNVYRIDAGVDFTLGNSGASNFLFNWSDDSGTFSNVSDPTIILSPGETYTFQRVTSFHPFVITDDTLPVSGTDGSYFRTTTSGAVIDAATLPPIADFTADPAPTSDFIEWTPSPADVGDYYYTCRVTSHTGMTGAIQVVWPPTLGDFDLDGDVDLNDFATFALCFAGAAVTVEPPGCGPEDFDATDLDGDGDVDLGDFSTFATNFTG
jgi:hypothetical protein